jgi:hypothetical protein
VVPTYGERAGLLAGATGILVLATATLSYALVPDDYPSWKQAQSIARAQGDSLGRGSVSGFWLTIVVGALFVAVGASVVIRYRGHAPVADAPAVEAVGSVDSTAPLSIHGGSSSATP